MASCIFQTVLFALAGIPYYQVLADARSRRYQISPGSHSKELPKIDKIKNIFGRRNLHFQRHF